LVSEFEHAKALAKSDPARGLAAFRRLQQNWPNSPLSPEIDLQIVSLLNRLGKHEESQRESEAFVQEHPDSPRAKELEHALQAGGASGAQQSKP
jgi:TolA-binding protein